MNVNRRRFLAGTAAGAVTGAAGLSRAATVGEMKYRMLGSTGYRVSEIGFGAMNTRDAELIHAAIDAGINYIDTAWKYMNGMNEQVVGRVMETKRDKVFLATKVTEEDLSAIPACIAESLTRLRTNHVDLLLAHGLHEVSWLTNEDLIRPIAAAKEKGQARFIGYSTHKLPDEYVDATLKAGAWEAVQVSYNFMSPPEVKSETTRNIRRLREAGIAVIAMKALAQGDVNPEPPGVSDRITSNQAALRWVLDNDAVDTVIPGMTAFEHLAEDLAAMHIKLSDRHRDELRRLGERMDHSYCRGVLGCTGCADQCPRGVCVAEINRCLGYAYGYGDERLAWENYRALPSSSRLDACGDCGNCTVRCVHGIDVPANIARARRLFA